MAEIFGFAPAGAAGYPTDVFPDVQKLARRRAIMASLLQQGMAAPQGSETVGGFVVPQSPLSSASRLTNTFLGAKGLGQSETDLSNLMNNRQAALSGAVEDYIRRSRGGPATEDAAGNIEKPAMTADPRAAVTSAMASRFPEMRSIGASDLAAGRFKLGAGETQYEFGRPVASQPQVSKSAIPPNWEAALPPGAVRAPTDPDAVFRMKGPDGQLDVYAVKFEFGKPIGYQKLDNAPTIKIDRASGSPYFSPVSTDQGIYVFDHRKGQMELKYDKDGKPVIKDTASPNLQGDIAKSKAKGKGLGEAQAKAVVGYPQIEANTQRSLALIDKMIGSEERGIKPHPGFESTVGWTFRPGARFVHGSKEADFMALLEQTQSGAFLEAFEALKGGGHITEIEGVKGTQAITRMRHAQSEADFVEAANEYRQILQQGLQRAKLKQTAGEAAPTPAPGSTLRFDAEGNLVEEQ